MKHLYRLLSLLGLFAETRSRERAAYEDRQL